MGWAHWLLPVWSTVESMIQEAQILTFIPYNTNTWDVDDMIDRDYYVCASLQSLLVEKVEIDGTEIY